MKLYSAILAFGLLLIAVQAAGATFENAEILDHRTVTLTSPQAARAMTLAVDVRGRDLELRLADNDAPFAALDAAQRTRIFAGGNRFLRGTVSGIDGSWVRLSWIDGRWSGGIFDGHELLLLEPAENLAGMLTRDVPAGVLVLYRLSDLNIPELTLAPPVMPTGTSGGSKTQREGVIQGAYEALPVTIVSDTQFSDDHGGNTAAVTAGRINFVDGIYHAEVGVGIALHHHEILVNNGTLISTNAETLLNDFRTFMNIGVGSGIPVDGVAHLFTGRDLVDNEGQNGVAGIAYQGGDGILCDSDAGYGVDEGWFGDMLSGVLFAHELGHNFGAPHDNAPSEGNNPCRHEAGGRIMNPSVSGDMREYSDCSLQQMAAEIASAECFIDTALFRDRFEQ